MARPVLVIVCYVIHTDSTSTCLTEAHYSSLWPVLVIVGYVIDTDTTCLTEGHYSSLWPAAAAEAVDFVLLRS